jgi:dihydrofolate synthase/folylpolyglutamate synthase
MTTLHSLTDWLTLLEGRHPKAIDLGLERVGQVADRLCVRQPDCPVITVGGTNGKGSTVATLTSIYHAAGYRVGSYSSPHLLRFNERICLDGAPVDDATLTAAFERVEAARAEVSLTYFEFTTLAALVIFRETAREILVLEVGLGGRLDAVNLVDADVAVITSIGIDHVEFLGNSREKIAYEKAGILRPGHPAICGDDDPPARLLEIARERRVPMQCKHRDFDFHDDGAGVWSWRNAQCTLTALPRPALALTNAATALAALLAAPLPVAEADLRRGLADASLPGRLQVAGESPAVLLDVAHNPHGAAFLMQQLPPAQPGQRTRAVLPCWPTKTLLG